MARISESVAFAVAKRDRKRLERLVDKFGHGNRSEFLRVAMDRMEADERAERLKRLQAFGARRAAERGVDSAMVNDIVHRVLRDAASGSA